MTFKEACAVSEVHQVEGPSADLEWDYRNSDYGVEWRDNNGKWHWLCEPLEIAADTRCQGWCAQRVQERGLCSRRADEGCGRDPQDD